MFQDIYFYNKYHKKFKQFKIKINLFMCRTLIIQYILKKKKEPI